MDDHRYESLSHDPIHGYIPFVDEPERGPDTVCERQIIDHAWVQRMRQIRQLQTAWWVFPSAEHSRFQHILGVMHLASRALEQLYPSLQTADPEVPPLPVVDSLLRMAGLLHDVGHGPFGHFFDAHYLAHFGLNHEVLGAFIVESELAASLEKLRGSPAGSFSETHALRAAAVAWLIKRPTASPNGGAPSNTFGPEGVTEDQPRWMHLLRSLFCGIYTVDNMDFVLRDAFMTGLNPRAFDLQRLLHYSSFAPCGLTIHERGMPALIHFLSMKAELFRNVYFHRTVRAIDLELADLFRHSRPYLFPGDPRDHLNDYLHFTEFSLLTDVRRWQLSHDPRLQQLGERWRAWLERRIPWHMVCQRNLSFAEGQSENSSVFSSPQILTACIRERLPVDLRDMPLRVDLARHIHRPHTLGATAGLNFYYDSSAGSLRPLTMHGLYRRLPISHTIARVYALDRAVAPVLAQILEQIAGTHTEDDLTNM